MGEDSLVIDWGSGEEERRGVGGNERNARACSKRRPHGAWDLALMCLNLWQMVGPLSSDLVYLIP